MGYPQIYVPAFNQPTPLAVELKVLSCSASKVMLVVELQEGPTPASFCFCLSLSLPPTPPLLSTVALDSLALTTPWARMGQPMLTRRPACDRCFHNMDAAIQWAAIEGVRAVRTASKRQTQTEAE